MVVLDIIQVVLVMSTVKVVNSKLTTRCSVLIQNLRIAQLVKNFPAFIEPEDSQLCSQESPLDHILSHMCPVHMLKLYFKAYFDIILPSDVFPSCFPSCISHRPHACYMSVQLIFLDFTTLIIFDED